MDENRQVEQPAQMAADELEALALQATVALVEERVVENLTRMIERLAQRRLQDRNETGR